jgi:hypothetical protein
MRPEIRRQLLAIAGDFMEHLGLDDLEVKDVTLSGSNAAYTYTPHSDIDVHIIVDKSKLSDDEVYRELFNAKKTVYNDAHDIKIGGYDVELYVQMNTDAVVSLGEYSILRNRWIKLPTKRESTLKQTAAKQKFMKLAQLSQLALMSNDTTKLDNLLTTIKRYRQAGLDEQGEFSPENLAFKALRSQGIMDQLYDHRAQLHSKDLSFPKLPTFEQYAGKSRDKNSWWNYRNQVENYLAENNLSHRMNKILKESLEQIKRNQLNESNSFDHNSTECLHELFDNIKQLSLSSSQVKVGQTVDILRINTINFAKILDIELYKNVKILKIDGNTIIVQGEKNQHSIVCDSITDDILEVGTYILLKDAAAQELVTYYFFVEHEIKKHGWDVNFNTSSVLKEASGYIPSEREKNDPRFKTALTVDVHPNTMKRAAKAMGLGTISRAGIPQQANPNGKFRR